METLRARATETVKLSLTEYDTLNYVSVRTWSDSHYLTLILFF